MGATILWESAGNRLQTSYLAFFVFSQLGLTSKPLLWWCFYPLALKPNSIPLIWNIHWFMIAYIQLYISSLLSRLTALACDSTWVTSLLLCVFFNVHWSGVLKCWHGWCHMKLLPSQRKFYIYLSSPVCEIFGALSVYKRRVCERRKQGEWMKSINTCSCDRSVDSFVSEWKALTHVHVIDRWTTSWVNEKH